MAKKGSPCNLENKVIENILESGDFNNTEIEKVLNEVRRWNI